MRGRWLTIRTKPTNKKQNRFGFIVGKKVSKLANKRNTLKRRLRAIVTAVPTRAPCHDFLIIAHPGAAEQTSRALTAEIEKLLHYTPHEKRHR